MHTHGDFVAAADLVGVGVFGLGADDLVFSASKAYFAFGLGNSALLPRARGRRGAAPGPERLDAEGALRTIERRAADGVLRRADRSMRACSRWSGRRYDLSSLRLCVSSGEVLPPAVFDAWKAASASSWPT